MTRRSTLQLFALVCLVATIGYAQNRGNSSLGNSNPGDLYDRDTGALLTPVADRQGANPNELDPADDRRFRLREGMTLVNQVGEMKEAGGRILFYPDGSGDSLQLLENLALERISNELDQPHRKWSVTGIVTEYLGGNYLLLHRAVLKARTSPRRDRARSDELRAKTAS